jgi:cobalt-precorrin 5A hydrolase/precorrin-3B C17-methyltransferase
MTALIVLSQKGAILAARLASRLEDAEVHGLAGRVGEADVLFTDTMAHLRRLFAEGNSIVGVCAAGILIRAVAPLLSDKRAEAPVVAVSDDGLSVVPLLGGHHGANQLARRIAAITGGAAAITTAGDVSLGIALDEPPALWHVANPDAAKGVTAALLAGEPVGLSIEAGSADWLEPIRERLDIQTQSPRIRITDQEIADDETSLVLHPPVLTLGLGCERGTDAEELLKLVDESVTGAGLAPEAIACVASLDLKMDEAAMTAVASRLGRPLRFFDAKQLQAETPRLANPSETVFRAVGCHGVAEAAALAAAGPSARLVVPKAKSARATCAIARSATPIDPSSVGRARGHLTIVGIGPGSDAWRTPEASAALRQADDIVGYGLYLKLVGDLIAGKPRHESALSEEESRVRKALDLAAEGKRVALVSSGDAGIYALAALAFELLDREDRADWNRIAIAVAPGVSALQAAAARIGAPLGHDFCAVSLSDLLTPWEDIERRLKAAAEGDFVLALYNPASQRRREQLIKARDILRTARPANTPVILARNLGRAGESVEVIDLDTLSPDLVDMLTLVLIGSSHTRLIRRGQGRWVYTPRGYERKAR